MIGCGLRRISLKAKIDLDDLRQTLREEVIKRGVVERDDAKNAKGNVERAANRSLKGKRVAKTEAERTAFKQTMEDLVDAELRKHQE